MQDKNNIVKISEDTFAVQKSPSEIFRSEKYLKKQKELQEIWKEFHNSSPATSYVTKETASKNPERDFANIWASEEDKHSFFPKEQLLKHFQSADNRGVISPEYRKAIAENNHQALELLEPQKEAIISTLRLWGVMEKTFPTKEVFKPKRKEEDIKSENPLDILVERQYPSKDMLTFYI